MPQLSRLVLCLIRINNLLFTGIFKLFFLNFWASSIADDLVHSKQEQELT